MISLTRVQQIILFLVLLIITFATRGHHTALGISLPDATIAAFFIAGILLYNPLYMLGLFAVAVFADYYAFQNGTSMWCILTASGNFNPAYFFLIPAYGVMWFGGRWFRKINRENLGSLGYLGLLFFVSTLISFIISDYSFYLFSGKYDNLSFLDYNKFIIALPGYISAYFGYTFMYVSFAILSYIALEKIQWMKKTA